jgi:hypothetical protein
VNYQEFISYFPEGKQTGENYMVRCPAHNDKSPSLAIKESSDGKSIMLNCFAQCPTSDILAAKGLQLSDLFTEDRARRTPALKGTLARTERHPEKPLSLSL